MLIMKCAVVLFTLIALANSENILVYVPFHFKSVNTVFRTLSNALIKNGHTVTYVTSQEASGSKGVEEIHLAEAREYFESVFSSNFIDDKSVIDSVRMFFAIMVDTPFKTFSLTYENRKLQKLVNQKGRHLDLIIAPPMVNEAALVMSYELQVPFVVLSPSGFTPFDAENLRLSPGLSDSPLILLPFTNQMSFMQRVANFLVYSIMTSFRQLLVLPPLNRYISVTTGKDIPPVEELLKNASLYMMNQHWSFDYPRSFHPNVIQVAGLHCRPAQPLVKELDDWLSDSGDAGVIYFSMGSIIQGSSMPDEKRLMFLEVFSRLPQKVLWKWETEKMNGLPQNVRLGKWLPQQDVLAHPKVRLFISHGGTLSTQESMYHGVPMVTIPIEADHHINAKKTEVSGAGINLHWNTLTADKLEDAIIAVLSNSRYKANTASRSALMRDLPNTAMETAMFWLEYVMRHKGAPHLRPGALSLSWFSYQLLDVYAFLLTIALVVGAFNLWVLRKIINRCCASKEKED